MEKFGTGVRDSKSMVVAFIQCNDTDDLDGIAEMELIKHCHNSLSLTPLNIAVKTFTHFFD